MVSDLEILCAKTGWTGMLPSEMWERDALEGQGWRRGCGACLLMFKTPLLKEGCNLPASLVDNDKKQSLNSHVEGKSWAAGTSPVTVMQRRSVCSSYRNQDNPRQPLKWKTALWLDSRSSEVELPPCHQPDHHVYAHRTHQAELTADTGWLFSDLPSPWAKPSSSPQHCKPYRCPGSTAFESLAFLSHLGEQWRQERRTGEKVKPWRKCLDPVHVLGKRSGWDLYPVETCSK